MGKGRLLGDAVCGQRRELGCDRRTDVGSDDKRDRGVEIEETACAKSENDTRAG